MNGPYTTVKRAVASFSSRCRPGAKPLKEAMEVLQREGLGVHKTIHKLHVFYKVLPNTDGIQEKLSKYNISREEYASSFRNEGPKLTEAIVTTIKIASIDAHLCGSLKPFNHLYL